MGLYEKYMKLDIDTSAICLEKRSEDSGYVCTPKGAKVFGWTGVDGIHFCFVRGFGEMVFAVSPMGAGGDKYVHPVAESFEDFLRLLLVCGDVAAIEQASCWGKKQFEEFLPECRPTGRQKDVLDTLRKELELSPMEEPFEYIKTLQSRFDYSRLRFPEDYYEHYTEPEPEDTEWKVCFRDGSGRKTRGGREVSIGKSFRWGDETWHIPAVYLCSGGLVVDFCIEIEPERIRKFLDDNREYWPARCSEISEEERERLDLENPMDIHFRVSAEVNGKTLRAKYGSGRAWHPFDDIPEKQSDREILTTAEHYGLDMSKGWVFFREHLPWATKSRPKRISSLILRLERYPDCIPGMHFTVYETGDTVCFEHPVTGVSHTLTVEELTHEEIPENGAHESVFEIPRHCVQLVYTISPDLPKREISVRDCAKSDELRFKSEPANEKGAASIGIIGGSDGPTAIFFTGGADKKPHGTCSSLHYEPVGEVEWRLQFHIKTDDDIFVDLTECIM